MFLGSASYGLAANTSLQGTRQKVARPLSLVVSWTDALDDVAADWVREGDWL